MALQGLFQKKLSIVNVGLELFYQDVKSMGCEAIQMKWSIPTTEDKRVKDILDRFAKLDEEQ